MDTKTINEIIISLLADIAPISYGWFTGSKENHITFFEYNMLGDNYMDDELYSMKHSIQVDLWGYSNLEDIKNKIIKILIANDFIFIDCKDLFEAEKSLYHKVIRVRITKEF